MTFDRLKKTVDMTLAAVGIVALSFGFVAYGYEQLGNVWQDRSLLDPFIALLGLFLCYWVWRVLNAVTAARVFMRPAAALATAACAMYCVTRFVHWAWDTPVVAR